MATYTVTFHQRLDNYAVVQTLEATDIAIGESITLAGLGHRLNGTHTVYAIPQYLYTGTDSEGDLLLNPDVPIPNQVMFYDADTDLERSAAIPTWHPDIYANLHLGNQCTSTAVARPYQP
jgi:hypothetical protein